MEARIQKKLSKAPESPGVYIFLREGKPIYIGKSKNIRERLRAYFELSDSRPWVPKLVEEADDIDWMVTTSEEEALLLEENLIRRHKPKYNTKMKETKTLPYVKITVSDEFPRILFVRTAEVKGGLFFGPFLFGHARELVRTLKAVFGLRDCTDQKFREFASKSRPCLSGQIGVCSAPCVGWITRDEYMRQVWRCVDFLRGNFSKVIGELERKMWQEAEKENFELAAKLRDRIAVLRKAVESHRIVFEDMRSVNFLSHERAYGKIALFLLRVREGRIFGGTGAVWEDAGQDIADLAHLFVKDEEFEVVTDIKELWDNRKFRDAQDGRERDMLALARRNALEKILQLPGVSPSEIRMLENLGALLGLDFTPRKVEVFDFSNLAGKELVGVKVHFEDGQLIPSRLRLYKVSSEGHDDYFALRNVLERRLRDGVSGKDEPLPDLIFIDGGRGHLSVALEVERKLNVNIPVVCIAKKDRNPRDVTLYFEGGAVKPAGKLLRFVLKLRDSAHKRAKGFAVRRATKIR